MISCSVSFTFYLYQGCSHPVPEGGCPASTHLVQMKWIKRLCIDLNQVAAALGDRMWVSLDRTIVISVSCIQINVYVGPFTDFFPLSLDPFTAHKELSLTEGNRAVGRTGGLQDYPDHPDRFDTWSQVLCREALQGRSYWEAEWDGQQVALGLTYESIGRKVLKHILTGGIDAKTVVGDISFILGP